MTWAPLLSLAKREPVLTSAAVQAGVTLALGFGTLSVEQAALVLTFTGALLALLARALVVPMAALPDHIAAAVALAANKDVEKIPIPPAAGTKDR